MQIFLHEILYDEKFIGSVKGALHSVWLNLNHEKIK